MEDEELLFIMKRLGALSSLRMERRYIHNYRLFLMRMVQVKFMFSKKATKIEKIFTVDLTLT